jgi:hypothetical protein
MIAGMGLPEAAGAFCDQAAGSSANAPRMLNKPAAHTARSRPFFILCIHVPLSLAAAMIKTFERPAYRPGPPFIHKVPDRMY